jgi:hypothetical protein
MIELDPNPKKRVRKLREADIEAYLVKRVEALGGTAEKFSSPARRSVPDRLISWPMQNSLPRNGFVSKIPAVIHFVECKAPGEEPTGAQERDHIRRRQMGFVVEVVDTFEAVDDYLEAFRP